MRRMGTAALGCPVERSSTVSCSHRQRELCSAGQPWAAAPTWFVTVLFSYEFFFGGVVRFHVVVEDLDELGYDLVALERGEQATVNVDRSLRLFERSRQRDAEACMFRLPGAVD